MNKFHIVATATLLAMMPAGSAMAQKLSNNAEMLLNEHKLTGKMRLPGASKSTPVESVGAYIAFNDASVLDRLPLYGVKLGSQFNGFITAQIPIDALREVSSLPEIDYISMGTGVELRMDVARRGTSVNDIHTNTNNVFTAPFTGEGVVVGVIDTGMEFAHNAFRTADGKKTRIKAVWNQNGSIGKPPEGYDYGVEYTTEEAIRGARYDTASQFHGSHTTGIAAGGDRKSKYYGVAPDADIVFVSFKNDNVYIADAIKYIFDYADKVNKPCVINMSLGSHNGPHDGTSFLDRVIDAEVGPGRIIVGAVGNEGQYALHASKTFTATDKQLKSMLIQSSDISHNIHLLEIWGTPGTNLKVKGCVVESLKGRIAYSTPSVDTSNPSNLSVAKYLDLTECGANASIIIQAEINPDNNAPHISFEASIADLSSGRLLGVVIDGEDGQTVNMWDVGMHQFSSNGRAGWTSGDVSSTAGEIGGTAKRIITVGSYDSRGTIPWQGGYQSNVAEVFPSFELFHQSFFSSMGPTADGRIVPHILAPGLPVISAINKYYYYDDQQLQQMTSEYTEDSDGAKYYYGFNMGTSMSTPVVAGTIALMLQARPDLTPEEALHHIQRSANTNPFMGDLPNNNYGAGRLNSLEAMKSVLGLTALESAGIVSESDQPRAWVDPGTSMLNLYYPGSTSDTKVSVYNIAGRLIEQISIDSDLSSFDASAWGKGVFILQSGASSLKVNL